MSSDGELYKRWNLVGNATAAIGDIHDGQLQNERAEPRLRFDPPEDTECRSGVALPVCMGGCADSAMNLLLRDNRCSAFHLTYRMQFHEFIAFAGAKRRRPEPAGADRAHGQRPPRLAVC